MPLNKAVHRDNFDGSDLFRGELFVENSTETSPLPVTQSAAPGGGGGVACPLPAALCGGVLSGQDRQTTEERERYATGSLENFPAFFWKTGGLSVFHPSWAPGVDPATQLASVR